MPLLDSETTPCGVGSFCTTMPRNKEPTLVAVTASSSSSTAAAAASEPDEEERLRLMGIADEEERRADAAWRELHEMQARRCAAAEEERQQTEGADIARRQAQRRRAAAEEEQAPSSGRGTQQQRRADDEPDESGWTPREQRALEAALRAHPKTAATAARDRWQAIAAAVATKTPKACLQRCRALAAAVKASLPPPLLRLQSDSLLCVLERLGGRALCILACTCKALGPAAHDDVLWMPLADALPSTWSYSRRDRQGEQPWRYTLRIRESLYGSWFMLTSHRAGDAPYLAELGTVERGAFRPRGVLPYRLKYGLVCELVQLEAKAAGGLNHRAYKAVAERLIALSPNSRSAVPTDLHMTIREIYKTCAAAPTPRPHGGARFPRARAVRGAPRSSPHRTWPSWCACTGATRATAPAWAAAPTRPGCRRAARAPRRARAARCSARASPR